MNTLRFDDDFLLKYGGLFQTEKLSALMDSKIEQIDERIKAEYPNRVTLYWYIHPEDKNEVLLARHLQIDVSDPKLVSSFANSFKSAFAKKFTSVALDERKKLFLSYAIIDHEGLHKNFSSITLGMNEKERYKAIASIDKAVYGAFAKVSKTSPLEEEFDRLSAKTYRFIRDNFSVISSLSFTLLSLLLLIRLNAVPITSIDYSAISFAIAFTIIRLIGVFVFTAISAYVFILILILFIYIYSQKLQMSSKLYLNSETVKFLLPGTIFLVIILFILPMYFTLISKNKDPITDAAMKSYLFDAQIPAIVKMKYEDINSTTNKLQSVTKNVLYLGEDGQNVLFLRDDDIHRLIYQDRKLTERICMAEIHTYADYMLPMIYAQTFDDRVYRRTRSKKVTIASDNLAFQEAFCFNIYPKPIRIKSTNEPMLLMGQVKQEQYGEIDKFYYLDMPVVMAKVAEKPEICQAKNEKEFLLSIMRSEVLKETPYKTREIKSEKDYEPFDMYQHVCYKSLVEQDKK